MNAYYNIKGLCPNGRGNCGFCIDLSPTWPLAVKGADLDQTNVNYAIQTMGRAWLDGCGFDAIFDPDNYGFDRNKKKKPGPKSRKLYDILHLRVQWGTWGPEHISVPGDACGLDIGRSIGGYRGGMSLSPHNVDNIRQAYLFLVIFTFFADTIILREIVG